MEEKDIIKLFKNKEITSKLLFAFSALFIIWIFMQKPQQWFFIIWWMIWTIISWIFHLKNIVDFEKEEKLERLKWLNSDINIVQNKNNNSYILLLKENNLLLKEILLELKNNKNTIKNNKYSN